MDCNQVPRRVPGKETRSPDDYELFLESLLEAPRGQRRPWQNGRFEPAYKNDKTAGMYPCIGADGRAVPGCSNPVPGMPPAGNFARSGVVTTPGTAPATMPNLMPVVATEPATAPEAIPVIELPPPAPPQ